MSFKSNLVLRLYLSRIFLASLLLLQGPIACKSTSVVQSSELAASSGSELVKERLPIFYDAAVAAIGAERTRELYADWGEHEVSLASDHYGTHMIAQDDMAASGSSEEEISTYVKDQRENLHRVIKGDFGEALLALRLKQMHQARAFSILEDIQLGVRYFVDEPTLRTSNAETYKKGSGRVDGLVCVFEDSSKLTILQLGESKMGTSPFIRDQAERFLKNLNANGIQIGDLSFAPEKINLKWDGGSLNLKDVVEKGADAINKQLVVLQSYGFLDTSRLASIYDSPMGGGELQSFVDHIFATSVGKSKQQELLSYFKSQRERLMGARLKELNVFIIQKGDSPKKHSEGATERKLANWVFRKGGWDIISPLLDPKARQILNSKFTPSLEELNNFIIREIHWPNKESRDSQGNLTTEGQLGGWVHTNGNQDSVIALLDPEARQIVEVMSNLKEFIVKEMRMPKQRDKDARGALTEEINLWQWVEDHGGPDVVRLSLDVNTRKILDFMDELNRFIIREKHWPRRIQQPSSENISEEEVKLGKRIPNHGGQDFLNAHLDPEAHQILDAMSNLKQFIRKEMRLPKQGDRDARGAFTEEEKLGQWVEDHGGADAIKLFLDEDTRKILDFMDELNRFIIREKHWPRTKGRYDQENLTEKEASLGKRIQSYGGQDLLTARLDPKARKIVEFMSSLKEFIIKEMRLPMQRDKDARGSLTEEANLWQSLEDLGGPDVVRLCLEVNTRKILDFMDELNRFIIREKHWPRQKQKSEQANLIEEEVRLGTRVSNYGGHSTIYSKLSPEAQGALIQNGWRPRGASKCAEIEELVAR